MNVINSKLQNHLLNKKIFGYDEKYVFAERQLPYSYTLRSKVLNENYTGTVVQSTYMILLAHLKADFMRKTSSIELNSNQDGVDKLLEKLTSSNNIDTSTVIFYQDWALNKDVRTTNNYTELKILEDKLKYIDMNFLGRVYINSEQFKFGFKVEDVIERNLKDDEIENECESVRLNNGKYNIDGAFVNKNDAIEFIKKYNRIYEIKFMYQSNFSVKTGFYLKRIPRKKDGGTL
jgi:hypothetical protein